MGTHEFLAGERKRQERANLEADPEARIAALEKRVEELTKQVAFYARPPITRPDPNIVYYSRRSPMWPWDAPLVGDNPHGMAWTTA